jgi:nicotinamidase-related amidase
MTMGSRGARLLQELGPEDSDLMLTRIQGLGPMTGTELDPVLRHLGVTTIVGIGASLNVALTNLAFDAVNRGYQFVLPRDAAVGVPAEYAEQVIANTLSLVATVTTSEAIMKSWARSTAE